ncbi:MAG: tetratricopeptide repeat protein, partial [Nannocystaceae bacterium]|nr:tetratricopeptide repeat protein [Nannocystaceae bacterium]
GRGLYVHPPPEDPEAVTALAKVLELEALDGAIAPQAKALGKTLRIEFAEALIRLGDRYYERDGGAPFAADFYATALVFTPDNQHASGRVALSDAQLATLVHQAESQSFSDRQLAAAQPLTILAADDAGRRDEKLRRFLARDRTTPARTRTMLAGLVRADPTPTTPAAPPATQTPTAAGLEPVAVAAPAVDLDEILIEPDALDARKPVETSARASTPKVDRGRATSEAKQGATALAKGNLPQAASHFHRALEHDRRNLAALKGLAELHYERGQYAKAIAFGQRARALRPRSKRILLLIGDAHFKTLDYAAARKAYQRAKELGAKQADERLKRLARRLGQ